MSLEEFAKQIEKLRIGFLFDEHAVTENMTPIAEQHFLAALALLSQAEATMKLAHLYLIRCM